LLKLVFLSSLLLIAACSGQDQNLNEDPSEELKPNFRTNVIYGEDNRKDWYEVLDSNLKEAARATVGIFDSRSIRTVDGSELIETRNLRLCPTEKFYTQKIAAFCSGFLVGPDLVLTAGHCVETETQCKDLKFIFDFALPTKTHNSSRTSRDKIYSCANLVARDFTNKNQDWALIRLDRSVLDRRPLDVERRVSATKGSPLTIIGHPSGLPSKISRGGNVHSVYDEYFVADLDSFGGNSGSAVLNANTLKVEGLLVRGRTDYKNVRGCLQANFCEEGIGTKCKFPSGPIEGEHVSKISALLDLIPPLEDEKPKPEPEDPDDLKDRFISKVMLPIPDSSLQKVYSKIESVPALNGSDIKIRLVVEHAYISDLRITLIAPDKTRVILHRNTGPRIKNILGIYGGDLKPFDSLSNFGNQDKGEWTLELTDMSPFDKGHLIEWEIIPAL